MDKFVKKKKFLNQTFLYSGLSLSIMTPSGLEAHAGTMPYPKPRTQIQGTYVSGNRFMGDLDSLLPLYGTTKHFIFADLTGRYGSHNYWFVSPGGGLRGVYHNQLFGVYAFGDYQKTNPEAQFWVFNPGLEWMSPTLDVHLNGYFPNSRQKQSAAIIFDSNLGDYSKVRFQGHTQFDYGTTPMWAISRGADTELGYSIDFQGYRARLYGGGYYYHSPVNEARDIRGGFAGVQLPLNKFADVLVTNSYNNLDHNHVALTLRLTWDGQRKFSHNIEDRLLDRIERHSGIIQTAAGSLTQKVFHRSEAIYSNNIWFFEPGQSSFSSSLLMQGLTKKSLNSCTYEHPCTDFNQKAVSEINQLSHGANFYVKSGAYTLSSSSALTIYSGQSIYGRNANYTQPALDFERPVFTGAILAQGENTFDSLELNNNNFVSFNQLYFEHGIAALVVADTAGSSIVRINNSNFTVETDAGTPLSPGYTSALVAAGGITYLNQSTLRSQNGGTDMNNSVAYGLLTLNNAQVVGANNFITSSAAGRFAYGAATFNTSQLTLNNSTIAAETTGLGDAHALHLRDYSQAELSRVNLQANSTGTFAVGATTNQQSALHLKNSTIAVNMKASTGTARALYLRELSKSEVDNTSMIANSSGVNAYAVYTEQESVLALNNSLLRANTDSLGESIGLGLQAQSKISGSGNSIQAQSSGMTAFGAIVKNESILSLNNSTLLANMTGSGQAQGIQVVHYAQASLTKTAITANAANGIVFGGLLANNSKLNLNNSQITATMTGGSEVQALQIADSAQATISDSTIVANSAGTFSTAIRVISSGKLSMDKSTLTANGELGSSRGLQLENTAQATVNNSSINANSSGSLVFGTLMVDASRLTTTATTIKANMQGQQGEAQGIQVAGTSQAALNKTTIMATNLNKAAYGAYALQNGVLTLNQSTVVASTNAPGQAFGLSNASINSTINVSGFSPIVASGPNISFVGSNNCTLNGTKVNCG